MILNNKPLFHIAQLQLQFIPFVQLGGTNVLTRGFDVHETLSLVGAERITVLHGVPTQMVMMVGGGPLEVRPASLRCGFFGGQTLADDVTRKCMALFPGYFANVYGSTEALTVTCCDYRRHPDKLGSVGKASIEHGSARHPHRQQGSRRSVQGGRDRPAHHARPQPADANISACPSAPPPPLRRAGSCRATRQCSTTRASSP